MAIQSFSFLTRRAEQSSAKRHTERHTLEEKRRREASFSLILSLLEPRASSLRNGTTRSVGTGTPRVGRIWWYTQGVGGCTMVVYTWVYHRVYHGGIWVWEVYEDYEVWEVLGGV